MEVSIKEERNEIVKNEFIIVKTRFGTKWQNNPKSLMHDASTLHMVSEPDNCIHLEKLILI